MNPPRTIHKLSTTTPNTPLLITSATNNNIESMAAVVSTSTATLDLFILTFNAAKNLIDVPVFSAHLHGALGQNAPSTASGDGLPDLVAFSLQEVASLSYAFIGSYFLNPYYTRYEEALNLASAKFLGEQENSTTTPDVDDGSHGDGIGDDQEGEEEMLLQTGKKQQQQQQRQQDQTRQTKLYTLVRAKNVGMTAILLFARDPAAVIRIEEAERGFGAADMGNKGAVGLRVIWRSSDGGARNSNDADQETEVTFVAAHLAAMEWNLKKRNANWRSIASGLTFTNPRAALPGVFKPSTAGPTPDQSGVGDGPLSTRDGSGSRDSSEATSEAEDEPDDQPLLGDDDNQSLAPEHHATLRDASVFKPSSYLFVSGDLNYRISSTTPPPMSTFPSFDPSAPNHYSTFLPRDQLTQERMAGRAFNGMSEAPISFGPTYKYNVLEKPDGAANEAAVRSGAEIDGIPEVPWKFAPHRWPGWCDRVLFLDLPSSLKTDTRKLEVKTYNSLPLVKTSDHRAVFLRVQVPVVGGETMRKALEEEESAGTSKDPRANPPVPVDVHAWERREAARRKEMLVGFSAFLWSTQEGALLLATFVLLGLGSWWVSRVW